MSPLLFSGNLLITAENFIQRQISFILSTEKKRLQLDGGVVAKVTEPDLAALGCFSYFYGSALLFTKKLIGMSDLRSGTVVAFAEGCGRHLR
jgi:hypothetical protein